MNRTSCVGCSRPFDDVHVCDNHERQCKKAKARREELASEARRSRKAQEKADGMERKRKRREEKEARKKQRSGNAYPVLLNSSTTATSNTRSQSIAPDVEPELDFPPLEPDHPASPTTEPPPPAANPETRASGRPARRLRFPGRFANFVPNRNAEKLPTMAHIPEHRPPSPAPAPPPTEPEPDTSYPIEPFPFTTDKDAFGVWRVFPNGKPSFVPRDPDSGVEFNVPTLPKTNGAPVPLLDRDFSDPAPFSSHTAAILTAWQSSVKRFVANEDMNRLSTILRHPSFCADEEYSAEREVKAVDEYLRNAPKIAGFRESSGWKKCSVEMPLPCEGVKMSSEKAAPKLVVKDIWLRSLAQTIKGVFEDPVALTFELNPIEEYWHDPHSGEDERLHGEIYTSPAMSAAQEEINKLPLPAGETVQYERVVACLMQWSDATHLTNFGWAHLWPFYTMVGNQSKYTRCKPSCFACHHTAYAPDLPDDFAEQYRKAHGRPPSAEVQTHCKRELMHAVWALLLDEEFMQAYEFGIVVQCPDGVLRRIYPRFFTYAADYPERVLLATIKNNGRFPCPCCYIAKTDLNRMGTKQDMKFRETNARKDGHPRRHEVETVRRRIFEDGIKVSSASHESTLKHSEVPTRNAFGFGLGPLSDVGKVLYNYFEMFLPDVLHDFEVGIFKAVFIHLLRILQSLGASVIETLNARYREMPAFGRGTIRPFTGSASEMKKLAGRDFEDMLQCSIAVFDGLLPNPHNDIVLSLLFDLQAWHAYAKLRLHTTSTLRDFDGAVAALSSSMKQFLEVTCEQFKSQTFEIPKETRARQRAASDKAPAAASASTTPGKKLKILNITTVKWHRLASFPAAIRSKGTSESWGTAIGELNHSTSKRRYPRTNRHNFVAQLATIDARERYLEVVYDHYFAEAQAYIERKRTEALANDEPQLVHPAKSTARVAPAGSKSTAHHIISHSPKAKINIPQWLAAHSGDFALTNFWTLLKDYALARLSGKMYDRDLFFTDTDRSKVHIVNNTMYRHNRIRVNYTTYDRRRDYDVLTANHAKGRSYVLLLSPDEDEDGHFPYVYAHIVDVFHFRVQQDLGGYLSEEYEYEAAFVRYMEQDKTYRSGWQAKRLPRVSFLPHTDPHAFGFIDPADIIRAAHVHPAFSSAKTEAFLPDKSIARPTQSANEDYRYYYIGMFVDRDMVMLFRGGGVGHVALREKLDALRIDADRARVYALEDDIGEMPEFPGDQCDEDEDEDEEVFSDGEDDVNAARDPDLRGSDDEEEEDEEDAEMFEEAGYAAP